jgi:hypothetical protein
MGLLGTAIKLGAVYGIVKTGANALEKHNNPQSHNQQQSSSNQLYDPARNTSGFVHESYCNGQCGHRCHGENATTKPRSFNGQDYDNKAFSQ